MDRTNLMEPPATGWSDQANQFLAGVAESVRNPSRNTTEPLQDRIGGIPELHRVGDWQHSDTPSMEIITESQNGRQTPIKGLDAALNDRTPLPPLRGTPRSNWCNFAREAVGCRRRDCNFWHPSPAHSGSIPIYKPTSIQPCFRALKCSNACRRILSSRSYLHLMIFL